VRDIASAGAGFLLAVLWFDLMFDVQVFRHRGEPTLPENVVASIANYYRRVTTEARPMNRLIALVMIATVTALVAQVATDDSTVAEIASLALAVAPISLAAGSTVPRAVRLGAARTDSIAEQSAAARAIAREHVFCLACIATLLAVQLLAV
jgi:hypothetical protein